MSHPSQHTADSLDIQVHSSEGKPEDHTHMVYPLSFHSNDGKSSYGGRDCVGYGPNPPNPQWPNGAQVALNFVLNYEEGGENSLLHGDGESEKLLSEIVGASALVGQRNVNMESLYDYGSRAGFWRLHRLFQAKNIPCTVYAVGE